MERSVSEYYRIGEGAQAGQGHTLPSDAEQHHMCCEETKGAWHSQSSSLEPSEQRTTALLWERASGCCFSYALAHRLDKNKIKKKIRKESKLLLELLHQAKVSKLNSSYSSANSEVIHREKRELHHQELNWGGTLRSFTTRLRPRMYLPSNYKLSFVWSFALLLCFCLLYPSFITKSLYPPLKKKKKERKKNTM